MTHEELSIGPDLTAALNIAVERLETAERWRGIQRLIHAAMRSQPSRERYVRSIAEVEKARAVFDVLVGTYKPARVNARTFWVRGGNA